MQKSPLPILLPQAEPAPWPGYTRMSSFKPLIFCKESNNILPKSLAVRSVFTAKSGLPTSFKNNVSPVNTHCYLPFESIKTKQLLSSVWPGVWITLSLISPTLISSLSFKTLIPKVLNALGPK